MAQDLKKSELSGWLSPLFGVSFSILLGLFTVRLASDTIERLVYPFIAPIAAGLGLAVTSLGVVISIRSWVGLATPFIGLAADRFGKKRLMVIGLSTQLVGLLLMLVVDGWWAVVPMILTGLGTASFVPIQLAYVSDLVPYQTRGRALAFVDMAFSVAGILALPVVGWLIENYSWRVPYAILAAITLVTATLTWRLLPEAKAHTAALPANPFAGLQAALRQPAVWAAIVLAMLLFYVFSGFATVWALWLGDRFALSTTEIGLMATLISLAELAGVILSILFIDRIGKKRGVRLGFALSIVLLLTWLFIPKNLLLARVILMLIGGLQEFTIVSFFPLISDQLPEARATLFTLAGLGISVGLALGPAGNLFIWEQLGHGAIVGVMVAVLALAILLVSTQIRHTD